MRSEVIKLARAELIGFPRNAHLKKINGRRHLSAGHLTLCQSQADFRSRRHIILNDRLIHLRKAPVHIGHEGFLFVLHARGHLITETFVQNLIPGLLLQEFRGKAVKRQKCFGLNHLKPAAAEIPVSAFHTD